MGAWCLPAPHPPAGLLPVRLQGVFKSHRQVGSPPPLVPPPPAPGLPLEAVRLQSESGRSRPPWVLQGILGVAPAGGGGRGAAGLVEPVAAVETPLAAPPPPRGGRW